MNNTSTGTDSFLRDKPVVENEVHSSGVTYRKCMRLKDMSVSKEAGEKGETDQGKQSVTHKKRTRPGKQPTDTQPFLLTADAPFAVALDTVPPEDWYRTWSAGRTIMMRRTSKRVKDQSKSKGVGVDTV